MSNFLFLLGMYYPRTSANGVCCKNIIDELVRQGNNVDCVINDHLLSEKVDVIDGAHIFRVKPKLYYRISEWLYYHPNILFKNTLNGIASFVNKLYLFLKSSSWPYVSPSYTKRIYELAEKLCSENKYDVIVAEYTPIDTLYAGYLLKKKFPNIKFVPYYLDALAGGWGPVNWSKNKIDERTRKYEIIINQVADLVISMKSSEQYHEANPLPNSFMYKRVYLDVPSLQLHNNCSLGDVESNKSGKTIVLYSGSIHFPDRNPKPLLEHFLVLCSKIDVELWFMGLNNCPDLFEKYSKLTNGKIKVIGQFTHAEALKQVQKADILVNIGNTNPNTVTSKIFEYMQFRKPIISTFQIDNEPSIPYLKKYGSYFLLDERPSADFDSVNTELLNFIINKNYACVHDLDRVFYHNTPQAFIDAINTLCK